MWLPRSPSSESQSHHSSVNRELHRVLSFPSSYWRCRLEFCRCCSSSVTAFSATRFWLVARAIAGHASHAGVTAPEVRPATNVAMACRDGPTFVRVESPCSGALGWVRDGASDPDRRPETRPRRSGRLGSFSKHFRQMTSRSRSTSVFQSEGRRGS